MGAAEPRLDRSLSHDYDGDGDQEVAGHAIEIAARHTVASPRGSPYTSLVVFGGITFPTHDGFRRVMDGLTPEVSANRIQGSRAHTVHRIALCPIEPAQSAKPLLGGDCRAGAL